MEGVVVAPTVTKLPEQARLAVLLTGSHGGRYAGWLALKAGVRAAVFHDAGVGYALAGIGALQMFQTLGLPAAAVSHRTARIGDTDDMLERGVISHLNPAAMALGVGVGLRTPWALEKLLAAPARTASTPAVWETRLVLEPEPGDTRRVVLVDSASLVRPEEDRGAIVVTASHGGLVGGDPAMALRTDAFAAVFNDAGIGVDEAGLGRLPVLDARGIAAVTVAAGSAPIGDAAKTLEVGVVSAANPRAAALGAAPGRSLAELVREWARLPAEEG